LFNGYKYAGDGWYRGNKEGIKICPSISVIALSMYGEEEYYYKMVDAGAKGFFLKIRTFLK